MTRIEPVFRDRADPNERSQVSAESGAAKLSDTSFRPLNNQLKDQHTIPKKKKGFFRSVSAGFLVVVCWISVLGGVFMFGIDGLPIRRGPSDNTFVLVCLSSAYLGYKYANKYRWLFSFTALLLMVAMPTIFSVGKIKLGMDTRINYESGARYVGKVSDGKYNGRGVYLSATGNKYEGDWKDGKFEGRGAQTMANGDKYVGEFKDGMMNGQGTFTSPTGATYSGAFIDHKFNGEGTLTLPDGKKYVGEFKNDKFNGQGTLFDPSVGSYVGGFKDDLFNGRGTLSVKNGGSRTGIWKNGELTK
jgi:hypothetical protein